LPIIFPIFRLAAHTPQELKKNLAEISVQLK
jgi:hypothetical protein